MNLVLLHILLDRDLPVLSSHVLVVVMGTAHDLLLLLLLLLASLLTGSTLLDWPVEVTIFALVIFQLV